MNFSGFQQRKEKAVDAKIRLADLEAQYKQAANKTQIGKMTTLRNEISRLKAEYKQYGLDLEGNNEEEAETPQNDSPIKTDVSVQDEYMNSRWAALLAAHYEERQAIKSLKSQGIDGAQARKMYREAKNKNNMSALAPKKLKSLKSTASTVLKNTRRFYLLLWLVPLVLVFTLLSFSAAIISNPTRFVGMLGQDCVEAAGDDQVAAAKCFQDAAEQNSLDSFSNQGYI